MNENRPSISCSMKYGATLREAVFVMYTVFRTDH